MIWTRSVSASTRISVRSSSAKRRVLQIAGSGLAATSLGIAFLSPPATAASRSGKTATSETLPANLEKFANCPLDDPAVSVCLYSATSSTTFDIGSTTLTSTSPTTISLGLAFNAQDQAIAVLPDNGTQALNASAIPLPGGLLGIPGAPDSGPLAVTVTPQLAGLPDVNLGAILAKKGPGFTFPIDVLISNSSGLLGSDCTIGDAADPITLNLTTGKTDPPAPNTSISGSLGTLKSTNSGYLTIKGIKLVDNAFAVPGADNCGTDGILDEVLDLDKSLPSAAGNNTAILSGSSYSVPASLLRQYLGS
jgi:hypothetical protein